MRACPTNHDLCDGMAASDAAGRAGPPEAPRRSLSQSPRRRWQI